MSISIASFFHPYSKFLHGAAYNLHQILEGLGVVSSSFIERDCSGQLIPDTVLSFSSAFAGASPSLN